MAVYELINHPSILPFTPLPAGYEDTLCQAVCVSQDHILCGHSLQRTLKKHFLNHLFGDLKEKREATHVSLLKWTLCSGLGSAYCSQPSCYVTDNGSDPTTSSLPVVALGPATHRSSTTRLACWTRPDRTGPDQIGTSSF